MITSISPKKFKYLVFINYDPDGLDYAITDFVPKVEVIHSESWDKFIIEKYEKHDAIETIYATLKEHDKELGLTDEDCVPTDISIIQYKFHVLFKILSKLISANKHDIENVYFVDNIIVFHNMN